MDVLLAELEARETPASGLDKPLPTSLRGSPKQYRMTKFLRQIDPERLVEMEAMYQSIRIARKSRELGMKVLQWRHEEHTWLEIYNRLQAMTGRQP
jgi:hypothetical protein